jgi:hypothetical protein
LKAEILVVSPWDHKSSFFLLRVWNPWIFTRPKKDALCFFRIDFDLPVIEEILDFDKTSLKVRLNNSLI